MRKKKKSGIGERLKEVRQGLSQSEVANKVGLTQATYARYERGDSTPDVDVAMRICREFEINPTWLLTGEGPMVGGAAGEALERAKGTGKQTIEVDFGEGVPYAFEKPLVHDPAEIKLPRTGDPHLDSVMRMAVNILSRRDFAAGKLCMLIEQFLDGELGPHSITAKGQAPAEQPADDGVKKGGANGA